ncbi:unnamed protein product [Bemisia tabaci]|uniref:Uncharacterized protein n=1 Tax=Bemisia tabaci TaxID=7038 RepID=A0AAI8UPR6_BEMTA|nr:unnamed protein product [Bemisia tabaci]
MMLTLARILTSLFRPEGQKHSTHICIPDSPTLLRQPHKDGDYAATSRCLAPRRYSCNPPSFTAATRLNVGVDALEPDEKCVPLEHLISVSSGGRNRSQTTFKFILPCDSSKIQVDDLQSDGIIFKYFFNHNHWMLATCDKSESGRSPIPDLPASESLSVVELADLFENVSSLPHAIQSVSCHCSFLLIIISHFGRQCRVADYRVQYTNLIIELFDLLVNTAAMSIQFWVSGLNAYTNSLHIRFNSDVSPQILACAESTKHRTSSAPIRIPRSL